MVHVGDDFFYQATLRICGNLDIEAMLSDCLEFLKDVLPADAIALQVYDLSSGIFEDLAVVAAPGFKAGRMQLPLTPEAMALIQDLESGELGHAENLINRPEEHPVGRLAWEATGRKPRSYMYSMLKVGTQHVGFAALMADGYDRYTEDDNRLLGLLSAPFAVALTNALRFREVHRLQELLADDNRYLNRQMYRISGDEVVGQDFGLRDVMEMVRQVAPLDSRVLLLGETGVGKEVIANAIHHASSRAEGPFIKVNCGAIPDSLMDSELFGHEKGAFTGALTQKRGRFERAQGGTIFLDEIGELPLEAQVRLLRVIQTREIERVGGSEPIPVDIRIIAATHRDLPQMVREGTFREDLWFRINVFPITIPPLRQREMDIPALVSYFIERKTREMNLYPVRQPAPGSVARLQAYHWPGNVRELENVVERALIRSSASAQPHLHFDELNLSPVSPSTTASVPSADPAPPRVLNMDEAMKVHIESVLRLTQGKIAGPGGAAGLLGLPVSTLRNRMSRLGMLTKKGTRE